MTNFKADAEDNVVQEPLNILVTDDKRGIIDCLNSVILLGFYSRQTNTPIFDVICQNDLIENLIDTNRNYASSYLRNFNNMKGWMFCLIDIAMENLPLIL